MQAPVYGQCQQRLPLFLLDLLPLLSASAPSTVITCSSASEGSHQLTKQRNTCYKFDTHVIQIGCKRPRVQHSSTSDITNKWTGLWHRFKAFAKVSTECFGHHYPCLLKYMPSRVKGRWGLLLLPCFLIAAVLQPRNSSPAEEHFNWDGGLELLGCCVSLPFSWS